jgi:hypothetical protein
MMSGWTKKKKKKRFMMSYLNGFSWQKKVGLS